MGKLVPIQGFNRHETVAQKSQKIMGCCCARSKSSGGCCCCGRRGATVAFGLLGLLLASAVITPPVYIYKTDQDFTKMFPIFKFGRQYLAQIAGGDPIITETTTITT